ncbi:hypothetical protein EYF80_044535 [Liparis tanakae]|uniref:Uncharacterized protein n=1 Tax=Liparis tanakae TaxID=230148 RepID=A0A4Z2FWW5_9TELE|nr:hypothetical protein EYF80_044535 [Liparis tanakae]
MTFSCTTAFWEALASDVPKGLTLGSTQKDSVEGTPWSGLPQLFLQYGMSHASPFQYLSHSQYTLLAAELPGVHFPWPEQLLGQELILEEKDVFII